MPVVLMNFDQYNDWVVMGPGIFEPKQMLVFGKI